ncbi:hypothetical protein ACFVHB_29810 [Kitasatospora sp. NPDC127111]|uniref:hypothetical protein n=1 Tax=Kitasatospora sp. NPDC127111 TaxID=3345363 RepID=UPI00362B0965
MAVRTARQGQPFAELILEVGAQLHDRLMVDAVESGFVLAVGEPPVTSGVLEIAGRRLARLVLVGGRDAWVPASSPTVSSRWMSAAVGRGGAIVILVPPGTWPADVMTLPAPERVDVVAQRLERAREDGSALHGMVAVTVEEPSP